MTRICLSGKILSNALSRVELNTVQLGVNYQDLAREQAADPETPAYRTAITSLKWRDVTLAPGGPSVLCDISTGQPRPLVPASRRRQVFDIIHGLSHPSGRTMAKLLSKKCLAQGAEGRHVLGETVPAVPNQQVGLATSASRTTSQPTGAPPALAQLLGTTHHTTTAYNPAANGLVERFHRSLKASLMARCTAEDWKHQLPWVLLGLRTTPRADSTPSTAEKTYGEPLLVPGELVAEDCHIPSLQRLRDVAGKFAPCKRTYTERSATFTPPELSSATHVFVRVDTVRHEELD
ncbi:uncharacterized protein [Macrobrachium rosenbergii]|uniref:uncharacterized protein n=1 Tax=Macrobrachium rosenbergii TaxID=79674 RepID=UPI0034D57839